MNSEARILRDAVEKTRQQFEAACSKLKQHEQRCPHAWSETVYDPIIEPGYQVEGDRPGTMGVDWRPGFWVEEKRTPRWRRTCTVCGKKEETTASQITNNPVTKPIF